MRTRVRDQLNPYPTVRQWDKGCDQVFQQTGTWSPAFGGGHYAHIVDVPDDRPRPGDIYPRQHELEWVNVDVAEDSGGLYFGETKCWGASSIYGPVGLYALGLSDKSAYSLLGRFANASYLSDISNAYNYVVLELHAAAKSAQVQSFVTAREIGETVDLVRKPLASLKPVLRRTIARRNHLVNRGADIAEATSASYLQFQFGLKPLVQDIEGYATAAARIALDNSGSVEMSSARHKIEGTHHTKLSGLPAGRWNGIGELDVAFKGSTSVTGRVWYRQASVSLSARTAYELGLTSQGIPNDLWESTPFSFLVDYFYNVGSWIRAITPNPYIEILAVSVSERGTEVINYGPFFVVKSIPAMSCRCSNGLVEGSRTFKSYSLGGSVTRNSGRRVVNPAIPPIPAASKPLGFAKTMNVVALGVANTLPLLRQLSTRYL